MLVGRRLPAPRKARDADERRVHLVRPTPRPALPEVRCLTLEVPARRGWRSVVNRDASAVAGFERARGGGLLVSAPGPGRGVVGVGTWTFPGGLRGRAPLSPPPAFGLSAGGRPRAPARPLSLRPGPPATLAASGAYRCAIAGRPGSPLRLATASCRSAVSQVPRVDTAPRVGGHQGSRLTDPPAPAGRVSELPTLAQLSPARLRPPAPWLLPAPAARSGCWRSLPSAPLRVSFTLESVGAVRPPPR